jgi:acetolactate synthase-1/2/3 large subunit
MKIAVSELIVRYMEKLGVEVIFGMPGAHILSVYDCLYDSTVKTVLVKHEQGAAFMADGYARASGKVSACITTAGPGATNLVTGIANAYIEIVSFITNYLADRRTWKTTLKSMSFSMAQQI